MNASSLPTPGRMMFDELLQQPNLRLRIGEHVVDIGALRIASRPEHPRLTSKAAAVLIELVRHAGDTVTRDQLLDRVWAGRVTTPDVLTQAIKELRRGFRDDARPPHYIETIPKVGYRLLAPVSLLEAEPFAADPARHAFAGNDPDLADDTVRSPATQPRPGRRWVWAVAGLVLAAVSLAAALRSRSAATDAAQAWTPRDIHAVTSDPGSERRPSLSPDGTRVAYAQLDATGGVDRIVLRAIGQSQSVRLTAKSESFEEMPTWSPDGGQIAFERLSADSCTVYTVSSLGGPEREIGACQNYVTHYFDWTPDGKALVTAQPGEINGSMVLQRWDLATGARQPLQYTRTAEDQDLEAHYSPDGKLIAFRRGLAPYSDLCVMAAAGGPVRQLTQLHSRIRGLAWTADSGGLMFSSNHEGRFTLYSVDIAGAHVRPLDVGPAEYPAAARNADTVAYEIPRTTSRLAWVRLGSDDAVPELLARSTGSDGSPALSPDGEHIAFVSDRSGAQQVWLYDFAASAATALTDFKGALLINPAWSADGSRVLVTVRGKDVRGLVEIDLASRRQRAVSGGDQDVLSGSYGPDADSYLVVVGASARHNQLMLVEHAGAADERRTPLAMGVEYVQTDPGLRRVYYTKNAQRGLFARDLGGGDERLVTTRVEASMSNGWRLVDGRIWYVSKIAWKPTDLVELDPATGAERLLGHLQAELNDVAFGVTPARDRIVITPLGVEDTDVGAFRLGPATQR